MTEITLFRANVAGVSHAKPDFTVLQPNDTVTLVAEPSNPVDQNAIRVQHPSAGKLGYIPAQSTPIFHQLRKLKPDQLRGVKATIQPGTKTIQLTVTATFNF